MFLEKSNPIALTIDVEDWFHILGFKGELDISQWDKLESRVYINTRKILQILSEYDVHATFFILGWVAEKYPELIREIAKHGHEIGSHGYSHQLIYSMTQEQFRQDVQKSIELIILCIGNPPVGYRAPGFSITSNTLWALNILADLGFKFDSSIFPAKRSHGGIYNANITHYVHRAPSGNTIIEFPISVYRLFNIRFCFSGGGYLRILPVSFVAHCYRRIQQDNRPLLFYLHPREIDPTHPRMSMKLYKRFKSYTNLSKTESKLRWLLRNFQFAPMGAVLKRYPFG